jgi:hypothetical protein
MMLADPAYEAAERAYDAYESWCLANDLDPTEDHWAEFEDDMAIRAEAAAEARAEARAEAW